MSDPLDDILKSGKKELKKKAAEPEAPKLQKNARYPYAPWREPDAIVLIITTAKCMNCGAEYKYPNRTLQTRFGGFMPRFEGPLEYLHGFSERKRLRRELETFEEEVPFCQRCFEEAGVWRDEEYARPKPLSVVYISDDERPAHPIRGTNPSSVIKNVRGAPLSEEIKAVNAVAKKRRENNE